MNYLDTTNTGGHPLYLEDLGFIQDAYKEAIAGITQGLGADSYILSGCQKTLQSPGVWHISEGFVVLNKEVFKVPSHTVIFLNENASLYFRIQNEPFYSTPVIYKETGEQDVHFRRRAIVTTEITEWAFGIPTVSVLMDRLGRGEKGTLTLSPGWNGSLSYEVIGGVCHLSGSCWNYDINESTTISTISTISTHLMPKHRDMGYSGTIEPTSNLSNSQALGFTFTLTRIFGTNDRTWSEVSPTVGYISYDLSQIAPRIGILKITLPSLWPIESDLVIFNFSGVSWPIAPQ